MYLLATEDRLDAIFIERRPRALKASQSVQEITKLKGITKNTNTDVPI